MRAGIRSRPWAGLDIGSHSIKLLATQGGVAGSRYWLGEKVLPADESGTQADSRPEVVAEAIAHCLGEAGFTPRSFLGVSVGISGPDVIVKQISLPLMDEDEVGSALRFEARKHLPFDPQGMIIDFQILGRYASEKRLDVLLASVSQESLDRRLAPLRLIGMDADIVDAAPLALTNALVHHADLDQDAHVLLDIGHTASHLTLLQRGEPYFSRRLEFGGRNLSEAVVRALDVPFAEAEEFKLAAGSEEPGFKVDWEVPEMKAMGQCIRRDLVDDLRRSLAFYRTMGNLPEQLNLWISGGTARLPGLPGQLTEMLGLPVLLYNPLDHLSGEPRTGRRPTVGAQFTQAFGLALRAA
jgi:type IV pilus assembly protein PilM